MYKTGSRDTDCRGEPAARLLMGCAGERRGCVVCSAGWRDKLAGNGLPNVKKWCILSLLTVFSAMKKTAGEFKHRHRVSFAGKFYCRQRKSSVEVLSTDSGQVLPEDLSADNGQVLPENLSTGGGQVLPEDLSTDGVKFCRELYMNSNLNNNWWCAV